MNYEKTTFRYIDQLDAWIETRAAARTAVDAKELFYWFGFDMMGHFVFSKSFGMLQKNEWHRIIVMLQNALSLLGLFSPVPWLIQLALKLLPRVGILRDWHCMISWSKEQMQERAKQPVDQNQEPDLAQHLIEDAKRNGLQRDDWMWLSGDSLLAIIAGSGPIASTLIGVFYELARNPDHANKIFNEVQDLDVRDAKVLSKLPHLDGVIAEALRLYPVLPTRGDRKTMEYGVTIGGKRADCFERGHDFVPERWYRSPEMIRNKAAYAPFGTGTS
ncbi:MAG: hypothetical protein Q9179_002613 [Wetmoreana sp. 5 TL-2023]